MGDSFRLGTARITTDDNKDVVLSADKTGNTVSIYVEANGEKFKCAKLIANENFLIVLYYFYGMKDGADLLRACNVQANIVMVFIGDLAEQNKLKVSIGEDAWKGSESTTSSELQKGAREILDWLDKNNFSGQRRQATIFNARMDQVKVATIDNFPLDLYELNKKHEVVRGASWLITAMQTLNPHFRREYLVRIRACGFYGQFFKACTRFADNSVITNKTVQFSKVDRRFVRMPAYYQFTPAKAAQIDQSTSMIDDTAPTQPLRSKKRRFMVRPQSSTGTEPSDRNSLRQQVQSAPILTGAENGELEVVMKNYDLTGIYVSENNETPLFLAAENGHLDVVQWLAGKDPESVNFKANLGYTPLLVAAENGHFEVVEWLADNGGSVQQAKDDGQTPLLVAAQNGHLNVVQWLADNGGSVEQADNDSRTPLWYAAKFGYYEIVEFLAKKNPKLIAQQNNAGETPLFTAAQYGEFDIVTLLWNEGLKAGIAEAELLEQTNDDETPLIGAVQAGKLDIVKFFQRKGVSIKDADKYGQTPLWWASFNGRSEVAKWLVQKRVPVTANEDGLKPSQAAAANGNVDLVDFLKQYEDSVRSEGSQTDGFSSDEDFMQRIINRTQAGDSSSDETVSMDVGSDDGSTPTSTGYEETSIRPVKRLRTDDDPLLRRPLLNLGELN